MSLEVQRFRSLNAPDEAVPKTVVEALFPCQVVVVQAEPTLVDDWLYPEELAHIARAVPKRRAEFGTARVCARHALAELGIGPCSLVPNLDRSPHWPDGTVGTISHTDGYCAVAITLSCRALGLGLDVERNVPLPAELEPLICTERERRWLDGWTGDRRGQLGKLIFSAKEAFYKCQYSLSRSFLEFLDVELDVDLANQTFRVAHLQREGPVWQVVGGAQGRMLSTANLIITSATL